MIFADTLSPASGEINLTHSDSFQSFLKDFTLKLADIFQNRPEMERLSILRRLPPELLGEIMALNPLSVNIPVEYGGRGAKMHENLAFLAASSYQSLALSLTFGINGALFLQPLAKYGNDSVKKDVFTRFLNDKSMGGLMITEPDHGTDAFGMKTGYSKQNGMYHIDGTKHWAGLTGMADFWLLTARRKNEYNILERDVDFFVCDVSAAGQKIVVEEYFENLGLYQIPYGRNIIDVHIPEKQRLIPKSTGIHMMLDLLHTSRLHFPGMGLGFIKRMLDEALQHTRKRSVGSKNLLDYDQVQERLARLQAAFTITSSLGTAASKIVAVNTDLASFRLEANVLKTVTSDLMQESAQSLLQLIGAKGYKLNHIAGSATVDSRPFQIFEGSNDILYAQISESVIRTMKNAKEKTLMSFFKGYENSKQAIEQLKGLFDFELDLYMPQRKLVDLGKVISRVISMDYVIRNADTGFRLDLIDNAVDILHQEISSMITSFNHYQRAMLVEDYEDGTGWPGVRF